MATDAELIADLRLSVVELRLSNSHLVDAVKDLRTLQDKTAIKTEAELAKAIEQARLHLEVTAAKTEADRVRLEAKIEILTNAITYGKIGLIVIISLGSLVAWLIANGKAMSKLIFQ